MRYAQAFLAILLLGAGGVAVYRATRPSPAEPELVSPLPDTLTGGAHARLSVPGSPAERTFGLVGDVAMAGDGRTFVLDVMNREVSMFGASGERTALLGRAGPGPGEFQGPIALAVDDAAGRLYVLDERKQGLDEFSERGEWRRTVPLDFHASDLCFISGRLYVLGGRQGFLLHEVSPKDGAVLRSFAPDADSEESLLLHYRGGGYLGCASSGEIAFLPSLRPEVTRFSAERGTLLGTAAIPGYRAVRVRRMDGGSMQFSAPDGEVPDYGSSILPLPGGDWLLQVGRLEPRASNPHEFISVRSLRLSARDGQIRSLAVQLPRVMASGENVVYTVETSPHPAVRTIPNSLSKMLP
jgi:hypothetical protein